jgi:hypothetical protein
VECLVVAFERDNPSNSHVLVQHRVISRVCLAGVTNKKDTACSAVSLSYHFGFACLGFLSQNL